METQDQANKNSSTTKEVDNKFHINSNFKWQTDSAIKNQQLESTIKSTCKPYSMRRKQTKC